MNNRSSSGKARPCDACRKRKSKCVTEEGNGACVLCKLYSQQCTYVQEAQPRRRRSTTSSPQQHRNKRLRTTPGSGIEEYNELAGPTLLKRTLGLQNVHHSRHVGANDPLDVYSYAAVSFQAYLATNNSRAPKDTVRIVHPLHAFRIIPDSSALDHAREMALVDEIQATVGEHGLDLVQLYFRIVHPSFPILHRDVYLEKYARSHREFSPPLLAAVYLLASGYWSYSDRLARTPKPDLSKLQHLALVSLQSAVKRPKLSTVQAGLLLSQYQIAGGLASEHASYSALTAQLVELGNGLGLHLDASDWDIPDWEIQLRRRLGWALYMQDKWTSLLEGRPSLISNEEWDVGPLSSNHFPENTEDDQAGSSEVEKGRLVFMHMASLSVIVSDILSAIFSARARRTLDSSEDKLGTLLECVKPLQIRLKDWSVTLPDSLRMDTAASMKLSSVGYLRLSYLAVEVCIHRQLLKTSVVAPPSQISLAGVCRAAARERFDNAMDFIQRLQAQHLASFWYFVSAKECALIYSFGSFLELTASGAETEAYFSRKLKELKWALKVNSEAGASFMKIALDLIELSARMIPFDPGWTSPAGTANVSTTQSTGAQLGLSTSDTWDDLDSAHQFDYLDDFDSQYDYLLKSQENDEELSSNLV